MIDIEKLRVLCNNQRLIITQHCIKRMMERGIELIEIKQAIAKGEVIEDYPDDYPYPSCLILGEGIHIVAGIGDDMLWLITAYRPDPDQWSDDLKTRRVKP